MSHYSYYTYILRSIKDDRLYYGSTPNLDQRQIQHDLKQSNYTSKNGPFELIFFCVFYGHDAQEKAIKFEKYLKSGSGRAFVKRHICPPSPRSNEAVADRFLVIKPQ